MRAATSSLACLMLVVGCGGPDFGPNKPATPEQQAVADQAGQSLAVFTADTLDADAFGNMTSSIYAVANESFIPPQTVVMPRGLYAGCATVTPNRIDYNCSLNGTTLSGFVSRTISGGTTKWQVSLSVTTTQTSGSISQSSSMRLGGSITVAGNRIDGSLSLDADVHVNDAGHVIDGHISSNISYNGLIRDPVQQCITGGNIVVQVDADAGNASLSYAVRYTFTGCHMVMVAVAK